MKTLLLLLCFAPALTFAQITITSADFSNAGDTVRMSSTTDQNVDFSTTGTGWTWDFSSFVAESQTLLDFKDISEASGLVQFLFGGFAPVAYQASYYVASDDLPLDQIGGALPVTISDIFQFSRLTADSLASIGFSMKVEGNEIPFRSDTIEKRYAFPLEYGTTYNGRGFTEMDLNPFANIIWRQHRTRESEVDGWGWIQLPMGSFDVLRVHHVIAENDSLFQEFFGTPMWIGFDLPTAHIYEWIAPGEKEPVLRIETSEFGGNETVTNIEYRDTYNPLLADLTSLEILPEIYPNPAQEEIRVTSIPVGSPYVLVDSKGSTVANGTLQASQSIAISTLNSGTYILLVQSEGQWHKAEFIKQ